MIWRLKVHEQWHCKSLLLLVFHPVLRLLHIISYLFLTFPILLAVEISALAPALALITESEPIQLLGRKQSTFILSRFVLCHVNELRQLKKGSNKNQTHFTSSRNCTGRNWMAVVNTHSFSTYVLLAQLTLWNRASAGYYQVIQPCSL